MSDYRDLQSFDVPSLVQALGDRDGQVRQRAREALVEIGQPAVPALISLLASPEDQLRWEAAKALCDIADPSAAPGAGRRA